MGKYIKMAALILAYALIYFSAQAIGGIGIGIFYVIKYSDKLTEVELLNRINSSIFLITAVAALITFLIYVIIFAILKKNLFKRCKFNKISIKEGLFALIIGISSSAFCISFVNVAIEYFPSYNNASNLMKSGMDSILSMLCVMIFLPIFEEILFRGLIFNELRKNLNIAACIVIQAVIFGVFHGNLLQGIYTFILGIVLALVYYWTNSLWSAILVHIIFNIMGTLVIPTILYYVPMGIYVALIGGALVMIIFLNKVRNIIKVGVEENAGYIEN